MKTAKKPHDRPSSDVRDRKLVHGLGYEGRRLVRTPKRRLTAQGGHAADFGRGSTSKNAENINDFKVWSRIANPTLKPHNVR